MQEIWNITYIFHAEIKINNSKSISVKQLLKLLELLLQQRKPISHSPDWEKVSIIAENNLYLGRINDSIPDTLRFCLFI